MNGLKRIPEIHARLECWAVWSTISAAGGGCSSPLGYLIDLAAGRRVHGSEYDRSCRVPVDEIECSKTEDAVSVLPAELRSAINAYYLGSGGTMDQMARRIGIVKSTLWRRLAQADRRIYDQLYK